MTIRATNHGARINVPIGQDIAPGSRLNVYRSDRNGAAAVLDEDHRINPRPIACWPNDALGEKMGLGVGGLGEGMLGVGEGGFGLGDFPLGSGPLGYGSLLEAVVSDVLTDGTYVFAAVVTDPAGNDSDASDEATLSVAGTPRPPSGLSGELNGDQLQINWALSPDDN